MNCKPGDLAVFCGSTAGNNGNVVLVIEASDYVGYWRVRLMSGAFNLLGERCSPGAIGIARDSKLRPIRDNDGEDEMLRIAGKPEKIGV